MKFLVKSFLIVATIFSVNAIAGDDEVKIGSLKIEDAKARATVPAQKMSGGFLKSAETRAYLRAQQDDLRTIMTDLGLVR